MLPTDTWNDNDGRSYAIVAWAHGHEIINYQTFGSYQGEWLMCSRNDKEYYIWKGWYGSCSGCDSYEATFGWGESITRTQALEFAQDYEPFLLVPIDTMLNIVSAGKLIEIMPANIRDDYSDIDLDEFSIDTQAAIKLREGIETTVSEIMAVRNAEIKQRLLKAISYEKFIEEAQPTVIEKTERGELLKVNEVVIVAVDDASSDRRYLLRVPPQMETVQDAIAWTFNMSGDEYCPIIET